MFNILNANSRLVILVAMSVMTLSAEAKPKLSEVKGLPKTGEIGRLRIGSDAQSNVFVSWVSQEGSSFKVEKIPLIGVPEPEPTTIASSVNDSYLLVNNDGSYRAAWAELVNNGGSWSQNIKAVDSEDLSKVLDFGQSSSPLRFFFDNQGLPLANPPVALAIHTDVTRDAAGNYFLAIQDSSPDIWGTTLAVQKNDSQPINVSPYNGASSFGFGEGSNPNLMVDFQIVDPKIVINTNGDILLAWIERLVNAQRKANGDFGVETLTLVAQRFNNDLTPKDAKPLVVASFKNKLRTVGDSGFLVSLGTSTMLGNMSINMDGDGDFLVAYNAGKAITVKEPSSPDGIYYKDYSGMLMARQFINANGKLEAGKTMKLLSRKPKSGHPSENGKVQKTSMNEISIAITNAANNDFFVAWRFDYRDVYKTGIDFSSILQAARFSSQ